MLFKKDRQEFLRALQECADGIRTSNENFSQYIATVNADKRDDSVVTEQSLLSIQQSNDRVVDVINALLQSQKIDKEEFISCLRRSIDEGRADSDANNKKIVDIIKHLLQTHNLERVELYELMKTSVDNVQSSNLELSKALEKLVENVGGQDQTEDVVPSEEQQKKVAYALNLCAVSISQIIDYNDLRFMEQEYENILNNLNIEEMPKDETLLDVLKQILDVISFFRLQEGDKQLLEKEYQHKLKNAIWNAIPSPSIIIAGAGSGVWGFLGSLAMSAGTGYMNYRKSKADLLIEDERKRWELQRSALEQLHALRRQLFETSWKLADDYKYDGKLRLSSRQIQQFNAILADPNDVRRYDRLLTIKCKFDAYPHFLYHLGSAALHASQCEGISETSRNNYVLSALEHFNDFATSSVLQCNLLREDPTAVQCAFEYISALNFKEQYGLLSEGESLETLREKKILLLNDAVKWSDGALDAMQLCASAYIELHMYEEAAKFLNVLVNENYNASTNAQLLSLIYISNMVDEGTLDGISANRYYELSKKVDGVDLYPKPEDITLINKEDLDQAFIYRRKIEIFKRFTKNLEEFLKQKRFEFDIIWHSNTNIVDDLISYFDSFSKTLSLIYPNVNSDIVSSLQQHFKIVDDTNDIFNMRDSRLVLENINFASIMYAPINNLIDAFLRSLYYAVSAKQLADIEELLFRFVEVIDVSLLDNKLDVDPEISDIESAIKNKSIKSIQAENQLLENLLNVVKKKEYAPALIVDQQKVKAKVHYHDDISINTYIKNHNIRSIIKDEKIVMIIEDLSLLSFDIKYHDLVLTTEHIYVLSSVHFHTHKRIEEANKPYKDIKITDNSKELRVGEIVYREIGINYQVLHNLIKDIQNCINQYQQPIDDKVIDMQNIATICFAKWNTLRQSKPALLK